MPDTDLSIIIVNWNTREILRDCLTSVFASPDGQAAEVIVVDNASEDGSADMVATAFPQAMLLRNSENCGFALANNQGIALATGRHILLLNSDTLVHGNVVARSITWLDAHPDVAAMGCRVLNTDGSVQRTCSMYPSILNQLLLTSGLWKLPWPRFLGRHQMIHWDRDCERDVEVISGCYMMVRREVIDQIGNLDEAFFFFGEETDWCFRMREVGWRLVFAPAGEITHHGSVSARKLEYRRDILLSKAIVRLHRKHRGVLSALIMFAIIAFFNGSRAVFWSLAIPMTSSTKAPERARHFWSVLRKTWETWPEVRQ